MAGGGEEIGKAYITIEARGGESVAREVQKAQAAASGGGSSYTLPGWAHSGGTSFSGSTITGGGSQSNPVAEWAASVKESTAKVAENTGRAADGAARMSPALSKAATAASSLAGSAGFGPIPGLIARTTALLGPLGLAVSVVTGTVGLLAYKWIEAKKAAKEAAEEISRIREAFKSFASEVLNPASEFEKTLKNIGDSADVAKQKLFDAFKSSESIFNDNARAYENYWNERNKIDSIAEKTARELVDKSEKAKTAISVEADAKRADERWKSINESVKRERELSENLYKEIEDMQSKASVEGLKQSEAAAVEKERAIEKIKDRQYGASAEELAQLNELLKATTDYYDKKIKSAVTAETKIFNDEIEREREKANQIAELYTTAANQSRAAIQAAFGGGTSGLLQEMIVKLNVIATGIQRLK